MTVALSQPGAFVVSQSASEESKFDPSSLTGNVAQVVTFGSDDFFYGSYGCPDSAPSDGTLRFGSFSLTGAFSGWSEVVSVKE